MEKKKEESIKKDKKEELKFNTIKEAIEDIKAGKVVILMDDKDRENEGDFCVAAEHATPEVINFMSKYGRGLICLSLTSKKIKELGLSMMTSNNRSKFNTNFTQSIEAASGITTGISVYDRAMTIKAAIKETSRAKDIVTPGHIFPLKALEGGVLRRAGQTEGSLDLARLSGLNPSGVICEILAEDGTMARYDLLKEIAIKHNLKLITIKDLIRYRLNQEKLITKEVSAMLPTNYGEFKIIGFKNKLIDENYIVLTMGEWEEDEEVLTRVHSQCLTGDVFSSKRCDCQDQLKQSMKLISQEKKGVILYLPQEGRGIGIINKIHAYKLQEMGKDTVEANLALGFSEDLRDYGIGAQILRHLKIKKLRLLTNNPRKIVALDGFGIKVVKRVPIIIGANPKNKSYLNTKKEKLGHMY